MYYLADDAALGIFDEGTDVFHFLDVGELLAGHSDTIFQHTLRIDDAIGLMDGLDGFTGKTSAAQTNEVDTSVTDGLLAGNHERWNVLTGACTTLEHDVAAYMGELMEQTGSRDDGVVVDDHLTRKLRGVADDTAVADHTVVADMHVLHQQVAVANDRLAFRGCTAADGDILTDGVVVANLTGGILALELQILGFCGDRGAWEYLVVIAETCAVVERYTVQQFVVVADDDVLVYHAEGTNDVAITELCLGVNHCHGMNLIH